MLGPQGLGQKGSAPGSGLGHALPLLPPPWAPEEALHFPLVLMSARSRLLALGPQSASVPAADCAVPGAPLDTEGEGESRYQVQGEQGDKVL